MAFQLKSVVVAVSVAGAACSGCTGLEVPAAAVVYGGNTVDGLFNLSGISWEETVTCADLPKAIDRTDRPLVVIALPYVYDGMADDQQAEARGIDPGVDVVARSMPVLLRRDILFNPRDRQVADMTAGYEVIAVKDDSGCTVAAVEETLLRDRTDVKRHRIAAILSGRFFHGGRDVYMQTAARFLRIRPGGQATLSGEVIETRVSTNGQNFRFKADLPVGEFEFPRRTVGKADLAGAREKMEKRASANPDGWRQYVYPISRELNAYRGDVIAVEGDEIVFWDAGSWGVGPWKWRAKIADVDLRKLVPELDFVDAAAEFLTLADRLENPDSHHASKSLAAYQNILRATESYTAREKERQKVDGTSNIELAFPLGLAQSMGAVAALVAAGEGAQAQGTVDPSREFAKDLDDTRQFLPSHPGIGNIRGALAMAMLSLEQGKAERHLAPRDALGGFFDAVRLASSNPLYVENLKAFYEYFAAADRKLDLSTPEKRTILEPEVLRARVEKLDAAKQNLGPTPHKEATIVLSFPHPIADDTGDVPPMRTSCACPEEN
ncbi:MAG: hypothetical protein H7841_11595 [Magnetospirillum sp. WYHS-4]